MILIGLYVIVIFMNLLKHIVGVFVIFLFFVVLAPAALGASESRFIVNFKTDVTQEQAEDFLRSTGFKWELISMRGWEYVVRLPLTKYGADESPIGIEIKPNPLSVIRHASMCKVIEPWQRDPMKKRIEFCFGTTKADANNIIKSFDLETLSVFEPSYLVVVFVPFSADGSDKIPAILQQSSLVKLVERDGSRQLYQSAENDATSTVQKDVATLVTKEANERDLESFTDKFVSRKILLAGGIFAFALLVIFVFKKRK